MIQHSYIFICIPQFMPYPYLLYNFWVFTNQCECEFLFLDCGKSSAVISQEYWLFWRILFHYRMY